MKELLSLREAAAFLGCSERHLWTLARRRGEVPHVQLGGRIMFSVRHLRAWIDRRAGVAATPSTEAKTQ